MLSQNKTNKNLKATNKKRKLETKHYIKSVSECKREK